MDNFNYRPFAQFGMEQINFEPKQVALLAAMDKKDADTSAAIQAIIDGAVSDLQSADTNIENLVATVKSQLTKSIDLNSSKIGDVVDQLGMNGLPASLVKLSKELERLMKIRDELHAQKIANQKGDEVAELTQSEEDFMRFINENLGYDSRITAVKHISWAFSGYSRLDIASIIESSNYGADYATYIDAFIQAFGDGDTAWLDKYAEKNLSTPNDDYRSTWPGYLLFNGIAEDNFDDMVRKFIADTEQWIKDFSAEMGSNFSDVYEDIRGSLNSIKAEANGNIKSGWTRHVTAVQAYEEKPLSTRNYTLVNDVYESSVVVYCNGQLITKDQDYSVNRDDDSGKVIIKFADSMPMEPGFYYEIHAIVLHATELFGIGALPVQPDYGVTGYDTSFKLAQAKFWTENQLARLSLFDIDITEISSDIRYNMARGEQLKTDNMSLTDKLAAFEQEKATLKTNLVRLNSERDHQAEELTMVNTKIASFEADIVANEANVEDLTEQLAQLAELLAKAKHNLKVAENPVNPNDYDAEKCKELETIVETSTQAHIGGKAALVAAETSLAELKTECETHKSQVPVIEADIATSDSSIETTTTLIESVDVSISGTKSTIIFNEAAKTDCDMKVAKAEQKVKSLKEAVEAIEAEVNPYATIDPADDLLGDPKDEDNEGEPGGPGDGIDNIIVN
jgi:predicted  nucleic acid-binding Zn-ribbon protein